MGYDVYFINHTKKEYITHKKVSNDDIFEEQDYLLMFMYLWKDSNIEILGEEKGDNLKYFNEYKCLNHLKWSTEEINNPEDLMVYYYQNNL